MLQSSGSKLLSDVKLRHQSTANEPNKQVEDDKQVETEQRELTKVEKLKKAVKDYGSVVIIFHVGISLMSLGTCYLLVSS